jgi:two-component system LytT family response regulator
VIFVAAYGDYALKELKYSALDYLLKPVNIEELKLAVQKAMERRNLKDINEKLNNLLHNLQKPQEKLTRIAVPTAEGLVFIPFQEIVRLQAMGAYTYVYSEKSKIIATKNMKQFEELLPENMFCRIHNSHIINLNAVKNYQKGRGGQVVMVDGTIIEVASRRRELLLEKMKI